MQKINKRDCVFFLIFLLRKWKHEQLQYIHKGHGDLHKLTWSRHDGTHPIMDGKAAKEGLVKDIT